MSSSSTSVSDSTGRVVVTSDVGDESATVTAGGHDGDASPALTTSHIGQPMMIIHRSDGMEPGAAFFMGMIMGAFILWLLQREGRRRRHRPDPQIADVSQHDVAALARRTATLERIITDPATRTANEIEALR